MQDERLKLREDTKRLLRVSYEQQAAQGEVGLRVDLGAGAEERGLSADSTYLATLVDYVEVAGWIKPDPNAFDFTGGPTRTITSCRQRPASCQSLSLRQQVTPLQPNSSGNIRQGIPLLST